MINKRYRREKFKVIELPKTPPPELKSNDHLSIQAWTERFRVWKNQISLASLTSQQQRIISLSPTDKFNNLFY